MKESRAHLEHKHVFRFMEYLEDLLLLLINGEAPFLTLQARHKTRVEPSLTHVKERILPAESLRSLSYHEEVQLLSKG